MSHTKINIEDIRKVLPHRYPLLLIDRVVELSHDHIVAIKNISINEPQFMGHFPEYAVMPGVLQLEAMAQASGLITALHDDFDKKKHVAYLAGINNARFKRVVTPGDQLVIEAKITKKRKSLIKVEARAKVVDELASSADISLVIREHA